MARLSYMSCCGIKELAGISEHDTPEDAIRAALATWSGDRSVAAHFIFTQATTRAKYGYALANYIEENKLGAVVKSKTAARNPNTRRAITTWIWTPDWEKLRVWRKRRR